ncbi:hypothetical protein TVAG_343940 [Trichomonas vaginalis G3]|uniref:LisH domain-containing protein n=1 Tax=Trichomonas vaginalis (strain ATCC PRA-98 / G3) TaxID=412133 RepID=A2E7L5_TRIV3|nr:hypothetical protein TVAGG3_0598010 [Trichomonas vaginalis G3]EAY11300.1 hypothetical protein TVAG_343940 [Trichomonas vaginalis G3]KAI5523736.1 hypothetical protein TVAGG3_0598010 [Trichomonas vaginalis G3]|eukprot:XP_001323523.1 hypothetical protein [Trichomonas vaginalis G3]
MDKSALKADYMQQLFKEMTKCGIFNQMQSVFLNNVTQEIANSNIPEMKTYIEAPNDKANELASQVVLQFLERNELSNTSQAANSESNGFLQKRQSDYNVCKELGLQGTNNLLSELVKAHEDDFNEPSTMVSDAVSTIVSQILDSMDESIQTSLPDEEFEDIYRIQQEQARARNVVLEENKPEDEDYDDGYEEEDYYYEEDYESKQYADAGETFRSALNKKHGNGDGNSYYDADYDYDKDIQDRPLVSYHFVSSKTPSAASTNSVDPSPLSPNQNPQNTNPTGITVQSESISSGPINGSLPQSVKELNSDSSNFTSIVGSHTTTNEGSKSNQEFTPYTYETITVDTTPYTYETVTVDSYSEADPRVSNRLNSKQFTTEYNYNTQPDLSNYRQVASSEVEENMLNGSLTGSESSLSENGRSKSRSIQRGHEYAGTRDGIPQKRRLDGPLAYLDKRTGRKSSFAPGAEGGESFSSSNFSPSSGTTSEENETDTTNDKSKTKTSEEGFSIPTSGNKWISPSKSNTNTNSNSMSRFNKNNDSESSSLESIDENNGKNKKQRLPPVRINNVRTSDMSSINTSSTSESNNSEYTDFTDENGNIVHRKVPKSRNNRHRGGSSDEEYEYTDETDADGNIIRKKVQKSPNSRRSRSRNNRNGDSSDDDYVYTDETDADGNIIHKKVPKSSNSRRFKSRNNRNDNSSDEDYEYTDETDADGNIIHRKVPKSSNAKRSRSRNNRSDSSDEGYEYTAETDENGNIVHRKVPKSSNAKRSKSRYQRNGDNDSDDYEYDDNDADEDGKPTHRSRSAPSNSRTNTKGKKSKGRSKFGDDPSIDDDFSQSTTSKSYESENDISNTRNTKKSKSAKSSGAVNRYGSPIKHPDNEPTLDDDDFSPSGTTSDYETTNTGEGSRSYSTGNGPKTPQERFARRENSNSSEFTSQTTSTTQSGSTNSKEAESSSFGVIPEPRMVNYNKDKSSLAKIKTVSPGSNKYGNELNSSDFDNTASTTTNTSSSTNSSQNNQNNMNNTRKNKYKNQQQLSSDEELSSLPSTSTNSANNSPNKKQNKYAAKDSTYDSSMTYEYETVDAYTYETVDSSNLSSEHEKGTSPPQKVTSTKKSSKPSKFQNKQMMSSDLMSNMTDDSSLMSTESVNNENIAAMPSRYRNNKTPSTSPQTTKQTNTNTNVASGSTFDDQSYNTSNSSNSPNVKNLKSPRRIDSRELDGTVSTSDFSPSSGSSSAYATYSTMDSSSPKNSPKTNKEKSPKTNKEKSPSPKKFVNNNYMDDVSMDTIPSTYDSESSVDPRLPSRLSKGTVSKTSTYDSSTQENQIEEEQKPTKTRNAINNGKLVPVELSTEDFSSTTTNTNTSTTSSSNSNSPISKHFTKTNVNNSYTSDISSEISLDKTNKPLHKAIISNLDEDDDETESNSSQFPVIDEPQLDKLRKRQNNGTVSHTYTTVTADDYSYTYVTDDGKLQTPDFSNTSSISYSYESDSTNYKQKKSSVSNSYESENPRNYNQKKSLISKSFESEEPRKTKNRRNNDDNKIMTSLSEMTSLTTNTTTSENNSPKKSFTNKQMKQLDSVSMDEISTTESSENRFNNQKSDDSTSDDESIDEIIKHIPSRYTRTSSQTTDSKSNPVSSRFTQQLSETESESDIDKSIDESDKLPSRFRTSSQQKKPQKQFTETSDFDSSSTTTTETNNNYQPTRKDFTKRNVSLSTNSTTDSYTTNDSYNNTKSQTKTLIDAIGPIVTKTISTESTNTNYTTYSTIANEPQQPKSTNRFAVNSKSTYDNPTEISTNNRFKLPPVKNLTSISSEISTTTSTTNSNSNRPVQNKFIQRQQETESNYTYTTTEDNLPVVEQKRKPIISNQKQILTDLSDSENEESTTTNSYNSMEIEPPKFVDKKFAYQNRNINDKEEKFMSEIDTEPMTTDSSIDLPNPDPRRFAQKQNNSFSDSTFTNESQDINYNKPVNVNKQKQTKPINNNIYNSSSTKDKSDTTTSTSVSSSISNVVEKDKKDPLKYTNALTKVSTDISTTSTSTSSSPIRNNLPNRFAAKNDDSESTFSETNPPIEISVKEEKQMNKKPKSNRLPLPPKEEEISSVTSYSSTNNSSTVEQKEKPRFVSNRQIGNQISTLDEEISTFESNSSTIDRIPINKRFIAKQQNESSSMTTESTSIAADINKAPINNRFFSKSDSENSESSEISEKIQNSKKNSVSDGSSLVSLVSKPNNMKQVTNLETNFTTSTTSSIGINQKEAENKFAKKEEETDSFTYMTVSTDYSQEKQSLPPPPKSLRQKQKKQDNSFTSTYSSTSTTEVSDEFEPQKEKKPMERKVFNGEILDSSAIEISQTSSTSNSFEFVPKQNSNFQKRQEQSNTNTTTNIDETIETQKQIKQKVTKPEEFKQKVTKLEEIKQKKSLPPPPKNIDTTSSSNNMNMIGTNDLESIETTTNVSKPKSSLLSAFQKKVQSETETETETTESTKEEIPIQPKPEPKPIRAALQLNGDVKILASDSSSSQKSPKRKQPETKVTTAKLPPIPQAFQAPVRREKPVIKGAHVFVSESDQESNSNTFTNDPAQIPNQNTEKYIKRPTTTSTTTNIDSTGPKKVKKNLIDAIEGGKLINGDEEGMFSTISADTSTTNTTQTIDDNPKPQTFVLPDPDKERKQNRQRRMRRSAESTMDSSSSEHRIRRRERPQAQKELPKVPEEIKKEDDEEKHEQIQQRNIRRRRNPGPTGLDSNFSTQQSTTSTNTFTGLGKDGIIRPSNRFKLQWNPDEDSNID